MGTPDPPPPFKVVRAFPNLKFDHPLLIARYPEGNRLIVGEQSGVLYSFADDPNARADVFLDLPRQLRTIHRLAGAKEVEAVYGLAFHPDFERNRQCFVCYTLRSSNPRQPNLPDGTRVSRFRVTPTDPPRLDPSSEEVVLSFLQGGHNGGDLHFGPDGMLYISTGDAANPNPPDPFNTGQDISDLLSSILRIDVDRKDAGEGLRRPRGQPLRRQARGPAGGLGLRLPQPLADELRSPDRRPVRGRRRLGVVGDGPSGREGRQLRLVGPGRARSPSSRSQAAPTPIRPALIELPHTIACSVTGGLVYRGRKFPELRGAYVFGDWETRRLWAARFEGDRTTAMPEIARPSVRIVAFCDDRDGEIYFLDHEGGTIHTIERNDAGAGNVAFPTRLSQTGLFADVKHQAPMPGVLPFAVNCRQWQDGATAEHWVAFPGESSATLFTEARPIPGMVGWHSFRMQFPKDAVLVRSISLAGRRLETQLLHYDGVDWYAYTYAWRDDQADAELVPADGAEKEVHDGARKRPWSFHSRSQCMSCHSTWSEFALAFRPEQLNRPGPDGRNQLIALTEAGLIRRADEGRDVPPAVRRRLGRPGTPARRPGRCQPAPGGPGPGLPPYQLRALPR